ncbi:MAG: HU family DNA-binding protein [Candidatus Parcubacteria bacterium]|nr:HU family DNA-binding protein [Candidatus Parcubacteria bacterium]
MTKENLAEIVVAKLECSKKDAAELINEIFDGIAKTLSHEEDVTVTGFGTFTVKRRAARMGVNPRTGEKISIAATKVPKFKAGKGLKDAVK